MEQRRKSFWTQWITFVAVLCCMLGAWFAFSIGKDKTVAKAEETLDVTDLITITRDDWMTEGGAATDCVTFSIRINKAGGGYLYEYLVVNSSMKGYWNDNGASFASTNGIDIMEYLYFNGESARSIVNKNKSGETSFTGTTFPLSIGGQYSPIAIETNGSYAKMMVLKDWMSQGSFILTIKGGFKLLLNDGKTITTANDVSFQYVNGAITKMQAYTLSFEGLDDKLSVMGGQPIGTLPAVPEKDGYIAIGWKIDGELINADTVYTYNANKTATAQYERIVEKVDATAKLGMENRTNWNPAENPDHLYFALTYTDGTNAWLNVPAGELKGYWNDHPEKADANFGVDIMEYLYINDKSVRDIVMANKNGTTSYTGTTFPFSAGSWYSPVVVEATSGSGLFFRVLNDYVTALGGTFRATIKAGFTITDEYNNVIITSSDIVYEYNGSALNRIYEYTLSFDGMDDVLTVTKGEPVGELPAVPEKEGSVSIGWAIDGVQITPDTVWNYDTDKTATALYVENYTLSFTGVENTLTVRTGEAIGTLPVVPERMGYTGVWKIDGTEINADTIYAYSKDKLAEAVYTPIAYTITIIRANGAEERVVFNVENKENKLAEVTLTAENEEYFYVWTEALPKTLELKNYTFTEVAMLQPEKTRVVSQSLSIGKDFTLNIYVKVIGDVLPTMQVSSNERAETLEGELVDEELNKYVYKVRNISATELSTVFVFRLIEGDACVDELECSAEGYLVALSQKEISAQLKTLIADIVCYAQAAEALVGKEDGVRAIDGLAASVYTDLTETDYKKTQGAKAGVEITSVYLSAAENNRITIRFTAESVENLVVKINGKTVEFKEAEAGSGVYQAQTDSLYIAGCNDRVKVVISLGETSAQTLIYSVKSYVYEKQNGNDEEMAAYVKALYNCSAALSAYAEGV